MGIAVLAAAIYAGYKWLSQNGVPVVNLSVDGVEWGKVIVALVAAGAAVAAFVGVVGLLMLPFKSKRARGLKLLGGGLGGAIGSILLLTTFGDPSQSIARSRGFSSNDEMVRAERLGLDAAGWKANGAELEARAATMTTAQRVDLVTQILEKRATAAGFVSAAEMLQAEVAGIRTKDAWVRHSAKVARCDPAVLGNTLISDPSKCLVQVAAQDGIVVTLPAVGDTRRIDSSKVPRCTRIGAQLMKHMEVAQTDFISPAGTFTSTFTFGGRCASLTLDCQVLDVSQPVLNKAPEGSVAMRCDANADVITEALQIIAPAPKKVIVRDFVAKCLGAAKAAKAEGPTDRAVASYMLVCDLQNPYGPEVRIQVR
jgi:hypothetical protein